MSVEIIKTDWLYYNPEHSSSVATQEVNAMKCVGQNMLGVKGSHTGSQHHLILLRVMAGGEANRTTL